jgi:hypothetical protein
MLKRLKWYQYAVMTVFFPVTLTVLAFFGMASIAYTVEQWLGQD